VVLAVGGVVYKVTVRPAVAGTVVADLEGTVGRSLGMAASGGGKVLYAFETDADGKKEKAVMMVNPDKKNPFYRWPDGIGDPAGAGWCGEQIAGVPTTAGAVLWFDTDEGRFRPLAVARTPGDKAMHVMTDDHWALLPRSGDPKTSSLVRFQMPPELPGGSLVDPDAKRPVLTLQLTEKGLLK
jgi:hypothetical protein